jgi:hypothetical protein
VDTFKLDPILHIKTYLHTHLKNVKNNSRGSELYYLSVFT